MKPLYNSVIPIPKEKDEQFNSLSTLVPPDGLEYRPFYEFLPYQESTGISGVRLRISSESEGSEDEWSSISLFLELFKKNYKFPLACFLFSNSNVDKSFLINVQLSVTNGYVFFFKTLGVC